MNHRVAILRGVLLLTAWNCAFCALLRAAEKPTVKVYDRVQYVAGVRDARAAAVVENRTTHYVLVAHSALLGGYIEIAPSCIGADKLTYKEIRSRVAKVENQYAAELKAEQDRVLQQEVAASVAAAPNSGACSGST